MKACLLYTSFDAIKKHLREDLGLEGTDREAISYAIYPKVFEDYVKTIKKEGNFRYMGSDIFLSLIHIYNRQYRLS